MRGRALKIGAALVAVAVAVAISLVFTMTGGGKGLPRPSVSKITEMGVAGCYLGLKDAQAVRFSVPGFAGKIDAAVVGTGKVGIVLAHQLDESMCEWSVYAEYLVKHGYRALAFSFADTGPADDDTVVAAANALRALGAEKIVLMGASRGGTAVLAAAGKQAVDGVIALSAPVEFGSANALAGVKASRAPLLIAVGRYDTEFTGGDIMLEKAAKASSKQLIVKPTGNHGIDLLELGPSVVDDAVMKLLARVRDRG